MRDILGAAATLLAGRGYADFTMRDVAAGAGVSAGTLYQYFDTKGDLYAALYEQRLRDQLAAVRAIPGDLPLPDVLRRLVVDFAGIYGQLGRHLHAWTAEGVTAGTPVTRSLHATFLELAIAVEQVVRDAIGCAGLRPAPGRAFLPFLWAVCNGVGEQLVDERPRLHGASNDDLVDFAAASLVRSLAVPE